MNILVYPHELKMGGSQINAIELAAAVRDLGHCVTVTAPEGILVPMIEGLGLNYVPTPPTSYYPSPQLGLHLTRLVRQLKIDLLHTYEWRPALEATFGPHVLCGTPLLMSILSMEVPDYLLPRHVPMVVGTHELTRISGREVYVVEPPIDATKNCAVSKTTARAQWNFGENEIVVSVVCRMTSDLEKLQGVLEAMDVIEALSLRWPFRFLVVGDGDGLDQVRQKARQVNDRAGSQLVLAIGSMLDPRSAYDAADIVIGMGSSVLKGMSFSKPVVVQGKAGFWRLLDQSTASSFFESGWFGHGGKGAMDLERALDALAGDPALRLRLGKLGRQIIEERFTLSQAASRLVAIYENVIACRQPFSARMLSLSRSAIAHSKDLAIGGLRAATRIFQNV